MNSDKNIKLSALAVLALGLAVFAGACQNAGHSNTAHSGNSSHTSNMNMAGHNNSMSSSPSNMAMNANGHDMSGMNHGAMTSDPDAASAPFDLQFIDTMAAHHEGAVEMAQIALMKSSNDELKKFAQKIIDDQKKEIAQMKDWREQWYAGKRPAKNMEMRGMADSMKMMMGDEMKRMETATGTEFDVLFLDMMTPHHVGAVEMAKEALAKAEHPEIKTLANQIIKAQESEIKMMADWKKNWSK